MNRGYIKLYRKLVDNPIIKKPAYLSLWIILLLKANHKEIKMIWNNEIIVIYEGQLITGRKQLSKESGIPETTIERILTFLENGHQIRQQKTNKYRLITIVNWKDYQSSDTKTDNRWTTDGQQMDTNKHYKNDKNEEEDGNTPNSPLKEDFSEEDKRALAEIVSHYNSKINPKARLLDKAKDKIKSRLGKFSVEEIKKAIENFSCDDWKMKNLSDKGLAWFFHSDERIEQYINLNVKKKINTNSSISSEIIL